MSEMTKKLDSATKIVLSDGEKIEALVRSDAWALVKQKLNERIVQIGNIMTLGRDEQGKPTNVENLIAELGARQMVVEIILDWLRDVEGTAEQHRSHHDQMAEVMGESHLYRVGDSEDAG
jgi:hypothetical protein